MAVGIMPIFRYLDTNGDSSGSKNANGDYSVTPSSFFIKPPANDEFVLVELRIHLTFPGSSVYGKYGSLSTLTNGISVEFYSGITLLRDFTDGLPIKQNDAFFHIPGRVMEYNYLDPNSGKILFTSIQAIYVWEDFQTGLLISGHQDQHLDVKLKDDFTGLLDHHFIASGYSIPEGFLGSRWPGMEYK